MGRVRGVRTGVVLAAGALVAALFVAVPAGASQGRDLAPLPLGGGPVGALGTEAAAGSDVPASERNGNLRNHPPGLPVPGTPAARTLKSAKVKQDLERKRISATIVLEATPAAATDSFMILGFGHVDSDGACDDHYSVTTETVSPSNGFSRSGATLKLDEQQLDMAGYMDWECAFVALYPPVTGDDPYDALVGGLVSTPAKPKLRISSVRLLNQDKKKVKFVRNTWTPLTVTVENKGRVDALGVKIVSGNKAFKVRKPKVGKVWEGGSTSARIEVRLVKKTKKAKLKLVARNKVAKGSTTRNAVRVAKPRKPVAGKYRAAGGKITFRVTKAGKVVDFRAKGVQMVCQPPLDYATYQRVTVSYPRKPKVRPNGILDVAMRWEKGNAWYNASLGMRVNGKKITQGRYTYTTAGYCRVIETFNPKRR